ncbi:putative transcription factor interactor and regulator CCHC(Zn) family [Helianthus annuus]|nr:putative transcription factor interactor and regulator CCHC(Zn) family [Helianthus annuus]
MILAKAVMGALPNYYFSMYLAPKKVIQMLDAIRRDFVWGRKDGKNKIRWIAWKKMVRPKRYGGFGIGDLRSMNLALLVKWGWKYKTDSEALWAKVVKAIHESKRSKKHIPVDNRNRGIWKDVIAAYKELESAGISLKEKMVVKLGNGAKTMFWLDNWNGDMPFVKKYPDLFKIVKNKDAKVADVVIRLEAENQWNIDWSRPPNGDGEWAQWSGMLNDLNKATSNNGEDRWGWMTNKWEDFSVAIIKDQLMKPLIGEQEEQWKHWNTWAPAKVNYFTWRTAMGRILVKSELRKRGIMLDKDTCSRCGVADESVKHLVSDCTSLKSV